MNLAEKLLVLLRDGRKLLGLLCSFDQFGKISIPHNMQSSNVSNPFFPLKLNLVERQYSSLCTANVVLQDACERVIVGDLYCDIPLGLYVIRGENVVLIGELV